jgi:hypothetical protein
MFWFEARRAVAPAAVTPGKYELVLQMVESASAVADAFAAPVTLAEHQRCV